MIFIYSFAIFGHMLTWDSKEDKLIRLVHIFIVTSIKNPNQNDLKHEDELFVFLRRHDIETIIDLILQSCNEKQKNECL